MPSAMCTIIFLQLLEKQTIIQNLCLLSISLPVAWISLSLSTPWTLHFKYKGRIKCMWKMRNQNISSKSFYLKENWSSNIFWGIKQFSLAFLSYLWALSIWLELYIVRMTMHHYTWANAFSVGGQTKLVWSPTLEQRPSIISIATQRF